MKSAVARRPQQVFWCRGGDEIGILDFEEQREKGRSGIINLLPWLEWSVHSQGVCSQYLILLMGDYLEYL